MPALDSLLTTFRRACRPPARLSPSQWASGRVSIQDGLTPKFQIENAPWQREPLDIVANADAKEVVFLAPIGTGKTTFMEAAMAYIIAEDPGPTLLVGQTDDDLRDWAETRMDYVIRNTPDVAALLPEDRHKRKKMQILFPHMALFLTGANLSGLQSKSMRRVFCDEAWQYRGGMLNEARGRLHDRWNRQFFMLSQAGVMDDDLDKAWKQTDQREFSFPCPVCGTVQPWKWGNVVFTENTETESLDSMLARAKAAHLKCDNEECSWTCGDNPVHRRAIAEAGFYVPHAVGLPGHVGFHYNVLCNWRKPLWEIVLLWLEAKEQMRQGILDPLRQFIQKRLAEPWEDRHEDVRTELGGDGYTLKEFEQGEQIDGEVARFFTIDKQIDHLWGVIRAWRDDGSSRKLWFGRMETFDDADAIRARYRVDAQKTLVDCGYMTDTVYAEAASRAWNCLKGSGMSEFARRTKTGTIRSPFTNFMTVPGGGGRYAKVAHWSSDRIKDVLYMHRTGQAAKWEIPDDSTSGYLSQLDAEIKKDILNKKTGQNERRWVKQKRHNHAWDCEAMQIVAAMMMRLVGREAKSED